MGTFCEIDNYPDRFYLSGMGSYDFERKMLVLEDNTVNIFANRVFYFFVEEIFYCARYEHTTEYEQ